MVFLHPRLAWPLLGFKVHAMNRTNSSLGLSVVGRFLIPLLCLIPTLLHAHPGHYHPDEVDEFDFFRATVFHPHGALDYIMAAVAITCLAMVVLHGKPKVRVAAALAALAAVALLPVF